MDEIQAYVKRRVFKDIGLIWLCVMSVTNKVTLDIILVSLEVFSSNV